MQTPGPGIRRIVCAAATRFLQREDGAVAILFGIVLLPLILSIGAAIDYNGYQQARAKLDEAADAGALAAALTAQRQIAAGASDWKSAAVTAGQKTFNGSLGSSTIIQQATPSLDVKHSGSGVTASLTYQAQVTTSLLKLIRIGSLSAAKTVTATVGAGAAFYNISLALDVSPSMAIAATSADITKMQSVTPAPGCAFACHDSDPAGTTSYYDIARANNVTLRLDILKSAAQALTSTVASASTSGQYKMGVYGVSNNLKTILAPTASMPAASTAISNIDFDTMSSIVYSLPAPAPANLASGDVPLHYADTDFATSLNALTATVPANGTGQSAASPKQIVIIVTDGVSDVGVAYNTAVSATYVYPSTPSYASGNDMGKLVAPIDPSLCAPLKNKGAIVAVLYVPYTPLTSDPNGFYQALVQTNAPQNAVTANLQACASSPALYYQATDLAGMTTGLSTLFNKAAQTDAVRLTN